MADAVQDCQPSQYLDRTATNADRELTWDFNIGGDPERCLQVQIGQKVFFNGVGDLHPLGGSGGDQPNPITFHVDGLVTFNTLGTFGFVCLNHSSMKGAIKVVQASALPASAIPVTTVGTTWALTLLLLLGGALALQRSKQHSKVLQTRRQDV